MDLWLDSQNGGGGKEDDGDYDSESDEEMGIRRGVESSTNTRKAEQVYVSEHVSDGGEEGLYFILCNPSKSKMFQGRSTGRRLKRLVLKFGLYQLIYGWVLVIIAIQETNTFPLDQGWFGQIKYGSSILNLTWCVSFPSVLFASLGMIAVRNWPSLVTNRELLTTLLQIYLGVFTLIFIVGIWCITVTFLTFTNVEWGKISKAVSPYYLYVATACFLLPYLGTLLYYLLDLHYLMDSLSSRSAIIREPGRHKGVVDLSDVTIWNTCGMFFCGIPFMVLFAVAQILDIVYRVLLECFERDRDMRNQRKAKEPEKKKKKHCCYRLLKTIRKKCCGCWQKFPCRKRKVGDSEADEEALRAAAEQEAADRRARKELEEQAARQRQIDEEERQRKADELALGEAEAAREAASRAEMEAERQRAENEYKKRLKEQEEIEAARKAAKEKQEAMKKPKEIEEKNKSRTEKKSGNESKNDGPTLNLPQFKSRWAALTPSGSFQCKLRIIPEVTILTAHLKKQGFCVVYDKKDNSGEIEIGLCNVRSGDEAVFMARFMIDQKNFNAVMKCENNTETAMYVKKFALAKVLKIDTT